MIQTIESATKAIITIGQNGFVVVSAEEPEGLLKAIEAIKMVEEQAHVPNLTERIQQMLGSNSE
jgi:exosome complex component RRP4